MSPALLWKIPSKAMSHLEGPCINGMQGLITATATANEFLMFTHRLVVLCICTKICENISKGFRVIDGWMTCNFTSSLTVFQSYKDNVQIMKGCAQWNSVYGWEDFTSSEDQTRSARSVGQRLTHWATGAPQSYWQDMICILKFTKFQN